MRLFPHFPLCCYSLLHADKNVCISDHHSMNYVAEYTGWTVVIWCSKQSTWVVDWPTAYRAFSATKSSLVQLLSQMRCPWARHWTYLFTDKKPLWIRGTAKCLQYEKYESIFLYLVAVFQCVFPLEPHLMTLHVDVKVLLIHPRLHLCRLSQPVQHLWSRMGGKKNLSASTFVAFPPSIHSAVVKNSLIAVYCTFCFSFSVQICLLFSTKLNKASCSLVSPTSFFLIFC